MRYFKAYWDESPIGPAEAWGGSWYFFELDDDSYPVRQIELFGNGNLLLYDSSHLGDEFGSLGDQALDPREGPFEPITSEEFEEAWRPEQAHNRTA